MERVRVPELIDDPAIDRGELSRALGYLRKLNRRAGGAEALLRHLREWSAGWPADRPITLLDLGTGSGDVPLAAARWARGRGYDLRATGIDKHETACDLAREHVDGEVEIVHADYSTAVERFGHGSFDYVHAGLFLHHLPELGVLTALAIMDRLARRGIVWNDLVRSPLRCLLVEAGIIGAPAIVKHDARVSVRAGFTRREVNDYARRVGVDYARYHTGPLIYRFTLAGEKPGSWA